jgi:hypothetical protein
VLLLENLFRVADVDGVGGGLRPRQVDQPIDVVAREGKFRDGRGHLLQPLQLLEDDLLRFLGQGTLFDLLAQRIDFGGGGIRFAQFPLNGPHLLAQEKIALALGHAGADVILDLGTEAQHFQFAIHQRAQAFETLLDVVHLQQVLALLEVEIEVGGDEVGQAAGISVLSAAILTWSKARG